MVAALERNEYRLKKKKIELYMKHQESPSARPAILEDLKLELKALPHHLWCVVLGTDDTLPVIIASELNGKQVESLVEVLNRFKRAIGLTNAGIIRIPQCICSMKIKLMPNNIPSIENQRRLNPSMQEPVKKISSSG